MIKIVEDLAETLIDDHHDHLRARTMQERRREKAKIDGRRQDLKAMYLRIFFYERPEDVLGGGLPLYSARRVLQIAKQHEIDVPPDRKAQLEAEIPIDHSHSDPRARAEAWLQSILTSGTSDVLIARPSEIRSARQKLLSEHRRDILLVFAVWQVTPTSEAEIASWFFTTAEQVRSDVLLIDSLKLLRPVKHKLERLLALTQQIELPSLDGSYPHSPSFKTTFQISSRVQLLNTVTAADKAAAARLVNLTQAAGEQRWSIATDPHRQRRLAVAAARVKRREREREKRKPPKLTRSAAFKPPDPANSLALDAPNEMPTGSARSQSQWDYWSLRKDLYSIRNRLGLRENEAKREISIADSTMPLNVDERYAIRLGISLEDWFVKRRKIMRSMVEKLGLPPPPDIDLFQGTEARDADNSTLPMTAEEQALWNASFQFQPQTRPQPQSQATDKASPSSGSGRRASLIRRRLVGKPKPLVKRVESGFRVWRFRKSTRGGRPQTSLT